MSEEKKTVEDVRPYDEKKSEEWRQHHPVFLTELEAADYLTLSYRSLRGRRALNKPPAFYKIGRRVVYRLEDILDLVKKSDDPTTSD